MIYLEAQLLYHPTWVSANSYSKLNAKNYF